jgi:F-type H+-transporting ATPase subunit b
MIFLVIVWGAYWLLVYKKLQQLLTQRHALTEGAVQQAQREIASAEARTSQYEQSLRDARSAVYKAQEARRQQMMARQSAALAEARRHADEMIQQARAVLEKEVASARAMLQQQSDSLANEIIDSILKPAAAGGGR